MRNRIFISRSDMERLSEMIDAHNPAMNLEPDRLAELAMELDRAEIVESAKVPPGVITMNSTVQLRDLDSGVEHTYRLVYPSQARGIPHEVSVLAPVGTALLGYRTGDVIKWKVPKGIRRLKVLKVLPRSEPGQALIA
jgi:regulator of nucleoside diphosphate kinase